VNASDRHFVSHGTRCAATYVTSAGAALTSAAGRPGVVMGHGFGATRDAGLRPFADRFAAAGADVLMFDYRGFGTSDGTPRQDVSHWRHRADYHRDLARAARRRPPHVVPIVGPPGSLAAITAEGAEIGYQAIMGPTFRNEMCARGIMFIPLNRPVTSASKLRCPLLVVLAERDNIAPTKSVRAAAKKAGRFARMLVLPSGHFDIYTGEMFEKSVATQVEFLTTT